VAHLFEASSGDPRYGLVRIQMEDSVRRRTARLQAICGAGGYAVGLTAG
jgi:hypothetical protein